MNISLSDYTLFHKFKAEHPELYWKLLAIYLNWYSAEHRYQAGWHTIMKPEHDEDFRNYWVDSSAEFYRVQGHLAPKSDNRFLINMWIDGMT